jgi:hypothetical protein
MPVRCLVHPQSEWIDDQYSAIAAECGYPARCVCFSSSVFPGKSCFTNRKLYPVSCQRRCTQARPCSVQMLIQDLKSSRSKSDHHHRVLLLSSDKALSTAMPQHIVEIHILRLSERLQQSRASSLAKKLLWRGLLMNGEAFSPVRDYQAKADPIKTPGRSRSEATVGFPPDNISS